MPSLRFVFAALFLAISAISTAAAAQQPPNVVMIISDDQSWTDYGFMGHEAIDTPRLDRLARESVVYKRAYVPTALCRPSLATMVTGLYAHQHGITGNDPARVSGVDGKKYQMLRNDLISKIDRVETLPQLLKQRGYLSHQSGKWWEGNFTRGGFTHGMTHGDPGRGGRHGDVGLRIGRDGIAPIEEFLDDAGEKPFFMWYAPFLPHTPHNPPARLFEKYSAEGRSPHMARYWAMCEWFDESVGSVLDALEKRNLTENTLIVYVCDNGWIQSTPEGGKRAGYAPRSKQSPYEGGTRTPIMFKLPGKIKPSINDDALVNSVDLAPTILSLCGVKAPANLPGIDLAPALLKDAPIDRKQIFGIGCAHDIADLDDPEASLLYRWTIRGKWKLLLSYGGKVGSYKSSHQYPKEPQLFDLKADPHEKKNLAAENPKLVAELAADIATWVVNTPAPAAAKLKQGGTAKPIGLANSKPSAPKTSVAANAIAATKLTPAKQIAAKKKRPNMVFILTDDQRWDMLGCVTPHLRTPHMDALAADGIRFKNAFVTTSICAASRASVFTGLVERTHGFTFGTPPISAEHCGISYPRQMRDAGYRTGFVGKYGVSAVRGEREKMFDVFTPLNRAPYFKKTPDGERHLSDITIDKAIEFLKTNDGAKPFCLSISFNAPHAEDGDKRQYIWPKAQDGWYDDLKFERPPLSDDAFFQSQPEFLKTSLNRVRWHWRHRPEHLEAMTKGYYKMISGVDAAIGRFREALKEQGFADDTVIVMLGDNGYFLGERGFAGKWLPYDRSLRVPLIIFDPRAPQSNRGATPESIALNIDIAPTLIDLAGLKPSPTMQGRSLVPFISGKTPAKWRSDFWCEHLMNHKQIIKHEGVREERYRYSRYFEQTPVYEEMFDLEKDPLETKNLINSPDHTEVVTRLRARTDELMNKYGGPFVLRPKNKK